MKRLEIALFAAACALAASAAAGCATTRSSEGKRIVVVCEDHALTGSHIGRARCYRRTEIQARGEHDRELMRREQQRVIAPDPEAGPDRR